MKRLTPLHTKTPLVNQLNKEKYGWSKWGDGRKGLYKGDVSEEWYCQACGEVQPKHLSPYLLSILHREYARICAKCQYRVSHMSVISLTALRDLAASRSLF